MATSNIEWTEKVWNPTTGCNKVSRGCKFCYAEIMHGRQLGMNPKKYFRPFLDGAFPSPEYLLTPLSWKKPSFIFVDSMSDLFHDNIPFEYIDKVFAVMALARQHTFQLLTKRTSRMAEYFSQGHEELFQRWKNCTYEMTGQLIAQSGEWEFPLPNVWLGTSIEDQQSANERIPYLVEVPAVVRWLSAEPLVGSIDLFMATKNVNDLNSENHLRGIHWLVAGGESGHGNVQPCHPDWLRSLQKQCMDAQVPFFFKQWGSFIPTVDFAGTKINQQYIVGPRGSFGKWNEVGPNDIMNPSNAQMAKVGKNKSGRLLDGKEYNEYPKSVLSPQSVRQRTDSPRRTVFSP